MYPDTTDPEFAASQSNLRPNQYATPPLADSAGGHYVAHDYPSEALWSVYMAEADKYDTALVEGFQADMDGTLIFAGLFSASVTTLIIESYKLLQPNSGDITVALLAQISNQLTALPNANNTARINFTPQAVSLDAEFKPTSSAIRVNVLWFLSLMCSLVVALSATLVKQWSRGYLDASRRRAAPFLRARVRSYLFEGLKVFQMHRVVEGIPTLLHLALFLFFAGLYEFLLPINFFVANLVLGVLLACAVLYATTVVCFILFRNCPYSTALSSSCWRVLRRVFMTVRMFIRLCRLPVPASMRNIPRNFAQAMTWVAMGSRPAWLGFDLTSRYQRDKEALAWTVKSLSISNRALEPFVEGIPGFLISQDVIHGDDILWNLLEDKHVSLGHRIGGLLASCHEGLNPLARQRRSVACITAIWSLTVSAFPTTKRWLSGFDIATLRALEHQVADPTPIIANWARCTMSIILSRLLQDMWNSSAGAATSNLRQDVKDLREVVQTLTRCAARSTSLSWELWTFISAKLSGLLAEIEAPDPDIEKAAHQQQCMHRFVGLLTDTRLLALVDVVVTLMHSSIDPVALMKRPLGVKLRYTPQTLATDSEYRLLRHLRRDLTAQFSDPTIQAFFVSTMGETTEKQADGLLRIHPVMMEDVLVLLGTINDPASKLQAKVVVERYSGMRPISIAAVQALSMLNAPQ